MRDVDTTLPAATARNAVSGKFETKELERDIVVLEKKSNRQLILRLPSSVAASDVTVRIVAP
jgi:hypothetical protein